MKNMKAFAPITLLFVLLNAFFIAGKTMLARWNADQNVLIIGNLLLFIITFVSFIIALKGLKSPNPHAFVRSIMSGIMLKLFASVIAAFIYIAGTGEVNKPALFIWMGLYLAYTFIEVSILTKMLRGKANG